MKRLKRQIVNALVGLYPARWKQEYGKEFADVLMRRPLGTAVVLNVVWNGFGQQLRRGEPWLIAGVPRLVLVLAMLLWNILDPGPYRGDSFSGGWQATVAGTLLVLGIGYWTVMRDPINGHAGRAAMKSTLLAAWPLSVIALLYGLGIVRIINLGPGDPPTTFHEHGFAFTLYDHARRPAAPAGLFVLSLWGVLESGPIGWLGGLAARGQMRFRRRRS
jgi:hypothetical protein